MSSPTDTDEERDEEEAEAQFERDAEDFDEEEELSPISRLETQSRATKKKSPKRSPKKSPKRSPKKKTPVPFAGPTAVFKPSGLARAPSRVPASVSVQERSRAPASPVPGQGRVPPSVAAQRQSPPKKSPGRKSPPRLEATAQAPTTSVELVPFSLCRTVADLFRVPLLLYLSEVTPSDFASGHELVIVGREAIDFHSLHPAVHGEGEACGPLEVLVARSEAVAKVAPTRKGRESFFYVYLTHLRDSILPRLNTYAAAMNAETRKLLEGRCSCSFVPGENALGIFRAELNEEGLELVISYASKGEGARAKEERHELARFSAYLSDKQGPVPRYVHSSLRLYGALGYLIERAEQLSKVGSAPSKKRYTEEHRQLIQILDQGSLSCESVSSSVRACFAKNYARDLASVREPKVREGVSQKQQRAFTEHQRLQLPESRQRLVDELVKTQYYPAEYAPVLTSALEANATDVNELLASHARVVQDLRR
jgi:hypothetical protein